MSDQGEQLEAQAAVSPSINSRKQSLTNLPETLASGEKLSIENYPAEEQRRKVNSPRTLEACRKHGVNPKELLFKPRELFDIKYPNKEISQMRFDFQESKRKATLD
jgi:hypothetical protein